MQRYHYFIKRGLDFLKLFFVLSVSIHPGTMQPERSVQGDDSRCRDNSYTYDVKRDVYNEETFQQEHRRKSGSSGNFDVDITTFRHHVQCRCVCVALSLRPGWQHITLFDSFWCLFLFSSSEFLSPEPSAYCMIALRFEWVRVCLCVCARVCARVLCLVAPSWL